MHLPSVSHNKLNPKVITTPRLHCPLELSDFQIAEQHHLEHKLPPFFPLRNFLAFFFRGGRQWGGLQGGPPSGRNIFRGKPVSNILTGKHVKFSSVQSLSRVSLFATPWTAARQTSLSITNSWSLLKLLSIESVMQSNCLILCRLFSSRLQSSPASGSFPMSPFFASGGQSIGVSASVSVLPMNIQD